MSTIETTTLVREVEIAARPETVWPLLVEPGGIARWMGSEAAVEAVPGGLYRVVVNAGHIARGEVLEVDPPHRLVVSWGWEPDGDGPNWVPPGSSTVVFELTAEGEGTRLRLTHRDLPDASAVDRHTHGWSHYLPRLATVAAGGDPGVDPWSVPASEGGRA